MLGKIEIKCSYCKSNIFRTAYVKEKGKFFTRCFVLFCLTLSLMRGFNYIAPHTLKFEREVVLCYYFSVIITENGALPKIFCLHQLFEVECSSVLFLAIIFSKLVLSNVLFNLNAMFTVLVIVSFAYIYLCFAYKTMPVICI